MGTLTDDGYQRDDLNTILTRVEARARALFGKPNLDCKDPDGFLANTYLPIIEELATLDELLEDIYNAPDPNRATRQSFAAASALRGVTRKPGEVGKHPGVTMAFTGAVAGTIERGAIRFHVAEQPYNIWINSEDIDVLAPGDFAVPAESDLPGKTKILLTGAETVILDGPVALDSITVPSDATSGTDAESEVDWRARATAAIKRTKTKIAEELEKVPGIVSANVVESPGYVHVYVNDGGSVADNVIAQTILNAKTEGVVTLGSLSGTAVYDGQNVLVRFDRAASTTVYIIVNVRSREGIDVNDLKNALINAGATTSGQDLIWSKLNAAVANLAGVDDIIDLFVGTAPAPSSEENLTASPDQRFSIETGNITVNVSGLV